MRKGGGTKQKISVKALVHIARKHHAQADAEFKHILVCVPVIFFLPTNPCDMYKFRLRHIHDPVLLSQDRNYILFCGTGMLIPCVSDPLSFLQFDLHCHGFLFCAHPHFFIRDNVRPEEPNDFSKSTCFFNV